MSMDQPAVLPTANRSKMRRIVVSLLKGGVAKSETSVHLAHGLALSGYKVLLVDTDIQSHCAEMLGVVAETGLADLIAQWASPEEAPVQARDNLWVLAGGNHLAAVKMEIARREMAPEAVLDEALAPYEGHFDYMIIDTAPGWDNLLVNALYCAEEVLSPVSMEPMALSGLRRFEERLSVIQKYRPNLTLRWILPTFVDGRVKKSAEIMAQLTEQYPDRLGPPIKYSVKLSEATAFGQTIFEHEPKGPGAKGYWDLVKRIIADDPQGQAPQPASEASPAAAPAPAGDRAARPIPTETLAVLAEEDDDWAEETLEETDFEQEWAEATAILDKATGQSAGESLAEAVESVPPVDVPAVQEEDLTVSVEGLNAPTEDLAAPEEDWAAPEENAEPAAPAIREPADKPEPAESAVEPTIEPDPSPVREPGVDEPQGELTVNAARLKAYRESLEREGRENAKPLSRDKLSGHRSRLKALLRKQADNEED